MSIAVELEDASAIVPWDESRSMNERRRGRGYPGLLGREHEKALKRGYVDLGLIDPNNTTILSSWRGSSAIAKHMMGLLWKDGVAFIRDPEDVLGSAKIKMEKLKKAILSYIAGEFAEQSAMASEAGDHKDAGNWSRMADAIRKGRVAIRPVKGRTGAGYKVTIRPIPSKLMKT